MDEYFAAGQQNMATPPGEIAESGYFRAGLRCQQLLAKNEKACEIPIILLTVLDHDDLQHDLLKLPPNVTYVPKTSDPMMLHERVAELMSRG